jgi:glucosyl-dolichyl phosphate glucuronosyltransferase
MRSSPDISIVIPTFNRASSLRLTLNALDRQLVPDSLTWEVIVVDNNSCDRTRSEVEDFSRTARIPVRYIFAAQQGVSHARNAGVASARAEVVGFTDDDADPARDWVATIATVMADTSADIVGGQIRPVWHRPPPAWLEHGTFLRSSLAIMDDTTPLTIVDFTGLPMIWGANMAFRRKVFDRVGAFNPQRGAVGYKLYRGEETDLIRRAIEAGFRVVYDPRLFVTHRIGPDRMRVAYFARFAFDQLEGEALVERASGELPGVVRVHARVARQVVRWVAAAVRRRPETLERWLECCAALGYASGFWKGCFRRRREA